MILEKYPKHNKKEFYNGFTGKGEWFIMVFECKPLEFL